jgi:hypothetical protein
MFLNNPDINTKLIQQVTVETFNSKTQFCETNLGNSSELEKSCNELTKNNCVKVDCCVFTNNHCVAGGSDGPTYKKDKNGNLITADTYYYLGKKYK